MAEFNGQFITNRGRNLLNRALAGEGKIIFTGAGLGDGKHITNLKEITDLKNKKLDMNVLSVRNDNGSAVLKLFVTNEKVEESFTTQEFGVYAKIEGDNTPILYSYATAIEPDTIPSNRFGTTYEAINEIYMSFVSDIDTDIQVTHGNIFLTLEVAAETFLKHGYVLGGKLKEQTQLIKDRVYSTDVNEHYLNIETRSWNRTESIDSNLIKLTFKDLIKFTNDDIAKKLRTKQDVIVQKSGFNLEKTDSYEEDDSNKLGTAKALKKLYDWARNKIATLTLSWDKITNKPNLTTTENLTQLLKGKENTFAKNTGFNKNFGTAAGTVMEGDKYEVIKSIPGTANDIRFIQDGGVKNKGSFYIDRHTGRIYKCIQQTSSTSNDSNYFQDVTLDKLSDRLDNLFEIREITSTQFTDSMGVREFAYYFDTKNLISAMPKDISGVVVEYLVFNNGSIFAGSKNQEVTSHTIRCVFFRNLRY